MPTSPALHRSRRMIPSVLACVAAAASAGCGRDADIRPDDVRVYTVPKAAEPAPIAAAPREDRVGAASQQDQRGRLTYDVPDGWTDSGASGMRLATLLIGDPADRREVTIIPASGSFESNVERWQGQLDEAAEPGARRAAAEEAVAAAETVDVDGTPARVVMLLDAVARASADEGQAILGAMIPVDDSTALFVKFKGDAAVARRERENFGRFVSSIRRPR